MTSSLFVRRFGRAGPTVVLLHGLGASGLMWRPVAERLDGTAQAFCPDLLGFGHSPRPAAAYGLDDHVDALDAALDAAGLGDAPVLLGGTSLGAALALAWAAVRPARFRGVALIALPAYRSADEARERIASLGVLAWATVARPAVGELICGVMCAGRPLWKALLPIAMPGVPADIAREMVLHDWVSYRNTLWNVLVEHRSAVDAPWVADAGLPVRLLHGDRDREAPLAAARALADACGWPLTVLPGRGHRLPFETPDACADLIRTLIGDAHA